MRDSEVLIVGAGPTGLVLALWLTRLGVRVRIVDKTAQPGTTSRALAVHARTLERYRQIALADDVVARGRKMSSINLWASGRRVAHATLGDIGAGISPFPYVLIFQQDEHERVLIDHLHEAGVDVERETEVVGFEEIPGCIRARLQRGDGAAETCEAAYIAGCDGAHSVVRQSLAIGFPGGTYEHLFDVADVEVRGAAMNGELHAALDESDFLAVFPLKPEGRARLVGIVRAAAGRARGPVLGRREHACHELDAHRGRARPLVFNLPRPPSRCGLILPGPRIPARRCGAHPQSGGWAGDEHRYRRRGESRVETGRRPARSCRGLSAGHV